MKPIVASVSLKAGKLHIRDRRKFDETLRRHRDFENGLLTLEKLHATRSDAQNRLYWGVYVETMSEATGYTPNECHEILKAHCLPHELAESGENGRLINGLVIGGSTAKLDKLQFGDYLKECARWIAERIGVAVPEPSTEAA